MPEQLPQVRHVRTVEHGEVHGEVHGLMGAFVEVGEVRQRDVAQPMGTAVGDETSNLE